jgi:tRNA dimethylallyltransferase
VERALEVIRASGASIVDFQANHGLDDRPFETLYLIVDRETSELDRDLRLRTETMVREGLLEEAAELLKAGWPRDLKPFKAIGYAEAMACLAGETTVAEAVDKTYLRTRRLAKRQRTWFRGQAPEGLWVRPDSDLIVRLARDFWGGQ